MVKIGAQHRVPLRQLIDLAERTRDPEASWWFRYLLAAGAGAALMLLVLTR